MFFAVQLLPRGTKGTKQGNRSLICLYLKQLFPYQVSDHSLASIAGVRAAKGAMAL